MIDLNGKKFRNLPEQVEYLTKTLESLQSTVDNLTTGSGATQAQIIAGLADGTYTTSGFKTEGAVELGSNVEIDGVLSLNSTADISFTGSDSPVTLETLLSSKQDTLIFDTTPISGSTNPITSGGIATALASKQNILTAGDNITIENNVISATGGGTADVPTYYQHAIIVHWKLTSDTTAGSYKNWVAFYLFSTSSTQINTLATLDSYIRVAERGQILCWGYVSDWSDTEDVTNNTFYGPYRVFTRNPTSLVVYGLQYPGTAVTPSSSSSSVGSVELSTSTYTIGCTDYVLKIS